MSGSNVISDRVIQRRFQLEKKLGAGSFGEIFEVRDLQTQKIYACKAENAATKHPQLRLEYDIYNCLMRKNSNFLKVYGLVKHNNYFMMLMDKLGDSLEQLFNYCGRRFSIPCVCLIAIQILNRIEELHQACYLHRDIKPDNFLVGSSDKTSPEAGRIYIIDLGLGKLWCENGRHIPERHGKRLIGTPRYASINTHYGFEQSRRDDMESLGYMLIYFANGQLPWQGLKGQTKEDKYQKIGEKKKNTSVKELCQGLPEEFLEYLHLCQNASFIETPPYAHFIKLFQNVLLRYPPARLDWQNPDLIDPSTKRINTALANRELLNLPNNQSQRPVTLQLPAIPSLATPNINSSNIINPFVQNHPNIILPLQPNFIGTRNTSPANNNNNNNSNDITTHNDPNNLNNIGKVFSSQIDLSMNTTRYQQLLETYKKMHSSGFNNYNNNSVQNNNTINMTLLNCNNNNNTNNNTVIPTMNPPTNNNNTNTNRRINNDNNNNNNNFGIPTINGMHNITNNNANNNGINNNHSNNNVKTGYIVNMFPTTYPTSCQQADSHDNNGHINNTQNRLNQAFSAINNPSSFNSFPSFNNPNNNNNNNNNGNNNNINANANTNTNINTNANATASNTNDNNNNNNNNNSNNNTNNNNNNSNNNNNNINLLNITKFSNTTVENTINKYQELLDAYTRLENNYEELKNRLAIETKEKSTYMQEISHLQTIIKNNQILSQQKDNEIEDLKKNMEVLRNQIAKTTTKQNSFDNDDKNHEKNNDVNINNNNDNNDNNDNDNNDDSNNNTNNNSNNNSINSNDNSNDDDDDDNNVHQMRPKKKRRKTDSTFNIRTSVSSLNVTKQKLRRKNKLLNN